VLTLLTPPGDSALGVNEWAIRPHEVYDRRYTYFRGHFRADQSVISLIIRHLSHSFGQRKSSKARRGIWFPSVTATHTHKHIHWSSDRRSWQINHNSRREAWKKVREKQTEINIYTENAETLFAFVRSPRLPSHAWCCYTCIYRMTDNILLYRRRRALAIICNHPQLKRDSDIFAPRLLRQRYDCRMNWTFCRQSINQSNLFPNANTVHTANM